MTTSTKPSVGLAEYVRVALFLSAFSIALGFLTRESMQGQIEAARIIAPAGGMVALTAVVWLLMVIVRNATILRGVTNAHYFKDYRASITPPEWVERPARTFNNLFQVPMLFYVVCLFMLGTGELDEAQLALAWTYVGVRTLHAVVYIGWNYVPYRFAVWIASCITLGVLWFRFVSHHVSS